MYLPDYSQIQLKNWKNKLKNLLKYNHYSITFSKFRKIEIDN